MKTIAIMVLSAALAAAIVSGILVYQKSSDAHDALQASEERVAELSVKLDQVSEEASALHDRLQESSERIQELEGAQSIISELEQVIATKEKLILALQRDLEQANRAGEHMKSALASKEVELTELKEQLNRAQSRIHSLEGEVAGTRRDFKELKGRLWDLKGEKVLAKSEIDQLRSTYEALISDLKQQIQNHEVTIEGFKEEISVTFVDRILFEFGEAAITLEGKTMLNKVGEALQTVRGKKIRVVGHTDDKPLRPDYRDKFPSNWELSTARASAVVRYLLNEIGLDPGNLEAVGRSFYDPVANNETAEGRAQNRRVEIIIAPQLE